MREGFSEIIANEKIEKYSFFKCSNVYIANIKKDYRGPIYWDGEIVYNKYSPEVSRYIDLLENDNAREKIKVDTRLEQLFDAEKTIIGTLYDCDTFQRFEKNKKLPFEKFEVKNSEDEMFSSLLDIVKEPININELETSIDERKLVEWLTKNAFPAKKKQGFFDNRFFYDVTKNYYTPYMLYPYKEFVRKTILLYACSMLIASIKYEDESKRKKYTKLLHDIEHEELVRNKMLEYSDTSIMYSHFLANKVINENINLLSYELLYNHLRLTCSYDLFEILFFHLAMFFCKQEDATSYRRFCIKCFKPFLGKHGNEKVCPACVEQYSCKKNLYQENYRKKRTELKVIFDRNVNRHRNQYYEYGNITERQYDNWKKAALKAYIKAEENNLSPIEFEKIMSEMALTIPRKKRK